MIDEHKIQEEVQKTLAVLDSVHPAEAPPFFYTRLKARLQASDARLHAAHILNARIVLGILGVLVLVGLNIYSIIDVSSQSVKIQKEQALSSLTEEYHLTISRY